MKRVTAIVRPEKMEPLAPLAGADAHHFLHGRHEDLAVAHLAGAGGAHDGVHQRSSRARMFRPGPLYVVS